MIEKMNKTPSPNISIPIKKKKIGLFDKNVYKNYNSTGFNC